MNKLKELLANYAKAHNELAEAKRKLQFACSGMYCFHEESDEFRRRFEEVGQPGFTKWVYADKDSLVPVEDPNDIAIIESWKAAYKAKVDASRKLGAYKGEVLKAAKKILKEQQ